MRLSVVLLLLSLLGVLFGGWLVGRWALGCAVIFDSLCVGVWALARDDGLAGVPEVEGPLTVPAILERARRAP